MPPSLREKIYNILSIDLEEEQIYYKIKKQNDLSIVFLWIKNDIENYNDLHVFYIDVVEGKYNQYRHQYFSLKEALELYTIFQSLFL